VDLFAREDQLAEPGDYVAFDLLGEPLVAVRGDDRVLRVLSAVCRHRYMPLVERGCGRARALQCPYHRWSYALDGRLLGAPDMQRTPGFERGQIALPTLPVEVWHGFVFRRWPERRAAGAAISARGADRALGVAGLPRRAAGLRARLELKIMVENFRSYHRRSASTAQTIAPASGTWAEDVSGPFIALHNPTKDGAPLPTLFPTRPKLSEAQRAEFLVGAVFPHLLFSLQPDGMFWYRMELQAADRFRLSIHPCMPAEGSGDPSFASAPSSCAALSTGSTARTSSRTGVQRGVKRASRGLDRSQLEKPIAQFHRWLAS
jgi:nitrite reductase/ring-hydroxylating ferredoxin subunit